MALSLQQVSNASLASHGAGRLNARLAPLLRLRQDARHIAAKPSDTSGEGGSLSDIDEAWHRFKKEVASQVEIKDRGAAVAPPASGGSPAADAAGGSRSAKDDAKRRAAPRPPPLSPKQEQLRRQESVLLDLWTSQDALRWAAVAVVAALALVLVVSGPPE